MFGVSLRALFGRLPFLVGVEAACCSGRGVDLLDEGPSLGLCSRCLSCSVSDVSGFMMGIMESIIIDDANSEDSSNESSVSVEYILIFEGGGILKKGEQNKMNDS